MIWVNKILPTSVGFCPLSLSSEAHAWAAQGTASAETHTHSAGSAATPAGREEEGLLTNGARRQELMY